MTDGRFAAAPGTSQPLTSLVVATTGRADRVGALVDRLVGAVEASTTPLEAVVVDNGARPSRELAALGAGRPVRVVRAAITGLAAARSVGTSAARGDVIVFTDDDVVFDDAWPGRMADPILAGAADVVAARVRLAPWIEDLGLPLLLRQWLAQTPPDDGGPVMPVGAGMAFHRDVLSVALWDPRLGAGAPGTGYAEETLFFLMAREAGARFVVADGPPVVHDPDPQRVKAPDWLEVARRKARSHAYVDYHWEGRTMAWPRLRAARRGVRLAAFRAARRATRDATDDDELLLREIDLVQSLEFARSFLALRVSPRAYWPRQPLRLRWPDA